ncbi:MAG TPA: response regulator, partial [Polyangia bacterium]
MTVEAVTWAPEPTTSRVTFFLIGDSHFRQRQGDLLRQNDIGIREAEDAAGLVELLQTQDVDGAVVELKRGTPASLALIETLRQIRPLLPVVVATAHPSVSEAVRIMQLGVDSYVAIPGTEGDRRSLRAPSELLEAVMRVVERQKTLAPLDRTRCLGSVAMNHGLVGESEAMKALLRDVALVAPTKTTVLVLGETGSGK